MGGFGLRMKQFFITLAAVVVALLIVFVALPIGAVVMIASAAKPKARGNHQRHLVSAVRDHAPP